MSLCSPTHQVCDRSLPWFLSALWFHPGIHSASFTWAIFYFTCLSIAVLCSVGRDSPTLSIDLCLATVYCWLFCVFEWLLWDLFRGFGIEDWYFLLPLLIICWLEVLPATSACAIPYISHGWWLTLDETSSAILSNSTLSTHGSTSHLPLSSPATSISSWNSPHTIYFWMTSHFFPTALSHLTNLPQYLPAVCCTRMIVRSIPMSQISQFYSPFGPRTPSAS